MMLTHEIIFNFPLSIFNYIKSFNAERPPNGLSQVYKNI